MKKGITLTKASVLIGSQVQNEKLAFGACVDSRLLKNGDLFFACSGAKCDGHQFLANAALKNASAAVVSEEYSGNNFGLPLIRVKCPRIALQVLAKKILQSYPTKIVAVTGSAGKTTTKEFLAHFLATKFRVASTPGNYNSQLGMPLTILNHIDGDEEMIVLEMGMTKAGHIASLVNIAPPDIALITGVSLAHAENFENLEAIIAAKAEIFSHPKTRLGIYDYQLKNSPSIQKTLHNLNHPNFRSFSFACEDQGADYTSKLTPQGIELMHKGATIVKLGPLTFPGKHNLHNFIAAALAANQCGIDWELIHQAAKTLTLPPMRLQIEEHHGITIVNDSYNALPVAVKAALNSLPMPKSGGKKIAVLSEMRELGSFSEHCHREVGEYALPLVDVLICLGDGCAPIYATWTKAGRQIILVKEVAEISEHLSALVKAGDVLLVKGSRPSNLSSLVNLFIKTGSFLIKA
ncbi:MAG: UDP-N-acetylmuramoyl-tripeptide--D-alanyl-D-alanine ligase [Parachlamydiaceae bacterium]|nr:UDP-N-acetylmuramoyl-tripeptide--D-alanyl-D-alanine ligase [Parachlamydiaceae bacterium]